MTQKLGIDWDAAKLALQAFIAGCKVVPGAAAIDDRPADPLANVVWEREAQAMSFGDLVELRISSEGSVGMDDVEDVEIDDDVFTPRVTGHSEFTLSIRFNSRSQVTAARNALSVVRASFHDPVRTQVLDDAGIGFLTAAPLVTFDEINDDRFESLAVLDVRLSITSELFDDDPGTAGRVGYLQQVGLSVNDGPEETIP
jgi:hypothetical protein